MENLSTYQHAERICESLTNGQRKQARSQFKEALADYCTAGSLLNDIVGLSDTETALNLAAAIIDGD